MGFFLVMKAEVVRMLIIMRRYWFATLIGIAMGYGTLMVMVAMFLGSRSTQDAAAMLEGKTIAVDGALGFMIGMFGFGIIGIFTQSLQGMARTGELEQVCMSPHGLVTNFFARSLVSAVQAVFSLSILLWLISFTLGNKLHATPVPTAALLMLTYINLLGFGFMSGGLVLVFKQIGQLAVMFRMVLLALPPLTTTTGILVDKEGNVSRAAHILPLTDATICLQRVLSGGAGWAIFSQASFFWLIVNCVLWNVIGVVLFRYMENLSRHKGTLGAY